MEPIHTTTNSENSDGPRVTGTIYNPATIARIPITELYRIRKEEEESVIEFEPNLREFAHVPDELKERRQWIVWRFEPHADIYGNMKLTEPAYNPKTGQYANLKNPETWSSFKEAVAVYQSSRGLYRGIGFVLTKDDPYYAVSLRDCFRDEPTLELTHKILKELNTYTEYACERYRGGPMKTRLHLIGIGNIPEGATHDQPNIEMYDSERYLSITGSCYRSLPLPIRQSQEPLNTIHPSLFGSQPLPPPQKAASPSDLESAQAQASAATEVPPVPEQTTPVRPIQPIFTPAPRAAIDIPDAKLLELAANAKNGVFFSRLWAGDWSAYQRKFQADLALCGMLAFWTAGDGYRMDQLFQQSGLYCPEQWHQVGREGQSYGNATIKRAISGCQTFYKPPRQPCPWLEVAKGEASQIDWKELSKTARQLAKERRKAEADEAEADASAFPKSDSLGADAAAFAKSAADETDLSALPKSGASRHTLRHVHLAMLELTRIVNSLEINVSSRRLSDMTGHGHATCNIARSWLVHFGLWEQVKSDDRFNPAAFRLRLEESHIEGVVEQLNQLFEEQEPTPTTNDLPQNTEEEDKAIVSDDLILHGVRPDLEIIQEYATHEAFLWSGGRQERQSGDPDKHPALGRIALELVATLHVQNGLGFNELVEATSACKSSVVAKCKALVYYGLAQIKKDEYGQQVYLNSDWREKLIDLRPKLENYGRVQFRRVRHLTEQLFNMLNIFVHRRTHHSQTVRQRAGRIWHRWRREKDVLLNMGSRLWRIPFLIREGVRVAWLWKHALEDASPF